MQIQIQCSLVHHASPLANCQTHIVQVHFSGEKLRPEFFLLVKIVLACSSTPTWYSRYQGGINFCLLPCTSFIFIINSNVWRAWDTQRGWCWPLIGQMTLILTADWLTLRGPMCNADVMAFMLTIMHINIIKSLVELSQMAVGHLVTVYLHQLLDFLPNYSILWDNRDDKSHETLGDRQFLIQEGF